MSRAEELRAKDPLPVALRPPGDFLWQEPPWKLNGQQPANAREPGIDYLTPYWTLRYVDEVVHLDKGVLMGSEPGGGAS